MGVLNFYKYLEKQILESPSMRTQVAYIVALLLTVTISVILAIFTLDRTVLAFKNLRLLKKCGSYKAYRCQKICKKNGLNYPEMLLFYGEDVSKLFDFLRYMY